MVFVQRINVMIIMRSSTFRSIQFPYRRRAIMLRAARATRRKPKLFIASSWRAILFFEKTSKKAMLSCIVFDNFGFIGSFIDSNIIRQVFA